MGLDQYLYRITKMDNNQKSVLKKRLGECKYNLDNLFDKYSYVTVSFDDPTYEDMKQYGYETELNIDDNNNQTIKVIILNETDEIMYWRKANQIRQWFVDNTGYDRDANLQYHIVTAEQLRKLISDCRKVITGRVSVAKELMPTSSGFFFGGTEYDKWYFNDIDNTINQLEPYINDDDSVFAYYEWW